MGVGDNPRMRRKTKRDRVSKTVAPRTAKVKPDHTSTALGATAKQARSSKPRAPGGANASRTQVSETNTRTDSAVRIPKEVGCSIAYQTPLGRMLHAKIENALADDSLRRLEGKVDLIFTSPPFPLRTKKKYGNLTGESYVEWMEELAPRLAGLLSPTGSLVIEIGNAWVPGSPVMSTLPLETLLRFTKAGGFSLCQQFICHNPARLPGPAQWVNVERIRVKDSYTHVWWLSKTERPSACNREVLLAYKPDMKGLLKSKKYNAGRRPSGHNVQPKTFLKDNGGAIPSNVLEFSNTLWSTDYIEHCKAQNVKPHPAKMAPGLVEFFIKFLTKEDALVLDPFGGSNTTGSVAERLKRRWIAVECMEEYIIGSRGRFAEVKK